MLIPAYPSKNASCVIYTRAPTCPPCHPTDSDGLAKSRRTAKNPARRQYGIRNKPNPPRKVPQTTQPPRIRQGGFLRPARASRPAPFPVTIRPPTTPQTEPKRSGRKNSKYPQKPPDLCKMGVFLGVFSDFRKK